MLVLQFDTVQGKQDHQSVCQCVRSICLTKPSTVGNDHRNGHQRVLESGDAASGP